MNLRTFGVRLLVVAALLLGMMPAQARMWPQQKPFQPTVQELHNKGRAFPPNHLHESWMDFLYWDAELEA